MASMMNLVTSKRARGTTETNSRVTKLASTTPGAQVHTILKIGGNSPQSGEAFSPFWRGRRELLGIDATDGLNGFSHLTNPPDAANTPHAKHVGCHAKSHVSNSNWTGYVRASHLNHGAFCAIPQFLSSNGACLCEEWPMNSIFGLCCRRE